MSAPKEVRPGQIWADNDKRMKGRTLQIQSIEEGTLINQATALVAVCTVLTDRAVTAARLGLSSDIRTTVGRTVRIQVRRFRQNATGYRLVSEPEENGWTPPNGTRTT